MPPKKKRRLANPNAQPGVAKKYILETFSSLPEDDFDLKNGHVLYVYIVEGQNWSRLATAKFLKNHFSSSSVSLGDLDPLIKRLLSQTLKCTKLRKLSNSKELSTFMAICEGTFKLDISLPQSTHLSPQPGTSSQDNDDNNGNLPSGTVHDDNDIVDPLPYTPLPDNLEGENCNFSTTSLRSHTEMLTPRKVKLKGRLTFVSDTMAKMKKRYKKRCKDLRLKSNTPRKVLNQTIRRKIEIIRKKDEKIHEIKQKLLGNKLSNELVRTREELNKLKIAHGKLLQYHKRNKKRTVSIAMYKTDLSEKEAIIRDLQLQNAELQETIEALKSASDDGTGAKINNKTYSTNMRLKVFDCIVNNVPTASIPKIITQFNRRSGKFDSVPHRSTVEMMARELGSISELQTAEIILANNDTTVGFDATTQGGTHINEVHFTTKSNCLSAAVHELPGGTAEDYADHICQAVDNLAETYCFFNDNAKYEETRLALISNITNSMSDRCAANHAAIRLVNSAWGKILRELNCHLHPLDSIASSARSALKRLEETRGNVFGKDCIAANIVVQMSKLRYKDGKGDPRGFTTFLADKNLPRNILPRFRGNRLHILFHNAGILIQYRELFSELLRTGSSLAGLRSDLQKDFASDIARVQLQVLGLIGKHLTGPWMKRFYTSADNEINYVDGINLVRGVLFSLNNMVKNPEAMLTKAKDFFDADIVEDETLVKLRDLPRNHLFAPLMKSCLEAIAHVLQRQYEKYFELDITETLRKEVESARSHNMDAEEIMGMFSAAQKKAPNATLCFLSSKMRATKNRTTDYLDQLTDERREEVLRKAVRLGRRQREHKGKKQKDLRVELIKRQKEKEQKKDMVDRRKLERILKKSGIEGVKNEFPDLNCDHDYLVKILDGRIVGKKICHVWFEENELIMYNGMIKKLYPSGFYKVAYWKISEDIDDATDCNVSMYELASDLLRDDLLFAD